MRCAYSVTMLYVEWWPSPSLSLVPDPTHLHIHLRKWKWKLLLFVLYTKSIEWVDSKRRRGEEEELHCVLTLGDLCERTIDYGSHTRTDSTEKFFVEFTTRFYGFRCLYRFHPLLCRKMWIGHCHHKQICNKNGFSCQSNYATLQSTVLWRI